MPCESFRGCTAAPELHGSRSISTRPRERGDPLWIPACFANMDEEFTAVAGLQAIKRVEVPNVASLIRITPAVPRTCHK